jgi:RNA-directed DNA polymerase
MKRYKRLYDKVYELQNLYFAAKKAQKGKRFIHEIADFNFKLEHELLKLQKELKEKTYRHGSYHQFTICEGKKRTISAAPYKDRVVHHALCNIIEPVIEPTFIHDSYACRKGKGTHAAVERLQFFLRKNRYAIKFDIKKYFPSIHHQILMNHLIHKIADPDVLWLIRIILDSYSENSDETMLWDIPRGIPIGNLTSQFFANVYLNPLDHFIKEELKFKAYIRYVDDLVLLHNDKRSLQNARSRIIEFIDKSLNLTTHEEKCYVFPVSEGIDFLGYRVFRNHRVVRNGNGYRFRARMKKL